MSNALHAAERLLPIQRGLFFSLRVTLMRVLTVIATSIFVALAIVSARNSLLGQWTTSLAASTGLIVEFCLVFLFLRWWSQVLRGSLDQLLVTEGLELAESGDYRRAVELFNRAVRVNPFNGMALNNIAYFMLSNELGDVARAFRYAQLAYILTPNAATRDTLGWAYYRYKRDLKKAKKHIQASLALLASNEPARRAYGTIYSLFHLMVVLDASGERNEAKAAFERLVNLTARNAPEAQAQDEAKKLAATWHFS